MNEAEDIFKEHDIHFDPTKPGQNEKAIAFLTGIKGIQASPSDENQVLVSYSILEHTLEEIESLLAENGFLLDSSLLHKMSRTLVHHAEDIQCKNLKVPEKQTKNSREIFAKVYDNHPHGDRDETPEEWREYR